MRGPSTAFNILTVVRPWPSFCFVFPERKGGKDIFSNHLFVFFCFLFDLLLPYDIKVGCCPLFFSCVCLFFFKFSLWVSHNVFAGNPVLGGFVVDLLSVVLRVREWSFSFFFFLSFFVVGWNGGGAI